MRGGRGFSGLLGRALVVVAGALLAAPASASAMYVHTVLPGESLTSVARQDGLTVAQLAAANGLSMTAQLIIGQRLLIPPQGPSGGVSPQASAVVLPSTGGSVYDPDHDGDNDGSAATGSSRGGSGSGSSGSGSSGSASSLRAYVVQPGDTLSAIAARDGTTVAQLAAANGLDPNKVLFAGTVLRLAAASSSGIGGSSLGAVQPQPVGAAAEGNPSAPPYPTAQTMSASTIGQIAAAQGVSPSLADAIAWQESGFNNALVSSADARGIMQILPGTWAWIQNNLVGRQAPLAPASATDNVRGGAIMLHWLLNATGGNPAMTAAGYYQGLPSVQQHGMYKSTQQYVNDVMSLRRQFGGG